MKSRKKETKGYQRIPRKTQRDILSSCKRAVASTIVSLHSISSPRAPRPPSSSTHSSNRSPSCFFQRYQLSRNLRHHKEDSSDMCYRSRRVRRKVNDDSLDGCLIVFLKVPDCRASESRPECLTSPGRCSSSMSNYLNHLSWSDPPPLLLLPRPARPFWSIEMRQIFTMVSHGTRILTPRPATPAGLPPDLPALGALIPPGF